jgi:hypothetical protein
MARGALAWRWVDFELGGVRCGMGQGLTTVDSLPGGSPRSILSNFVFNELLRATQTSP